MPTKAFFSTSWWASWAPFLGGLLLSPLLGVGTINQGITVASMGVSLLGAIILLALINLVRRGSVR